MNTEQVESLTKAFDDGAFLVGAGLFFVELIVLFASGELRKKRLLDMVASISTQIPSLLIEAALFSLFYVFAVMVTDGWVTWGFPMNGWTLALALVVCDFAYYWEHRIAHEVRIFWTQHAVHHSSRFMNTSVAVRFGPLEGVVSLLIHAPLLFVGFSPSLIFFGIITVLAYQTWIHTELIGRLPGLDRVLNTPSNHRVHHGSDEKYLDKNYGGIFMIWDHLFGTYQREEETPRYGLTGEFESVNPIRVWFSELPGFIGGLRRARSFREAWRVIAGSPSVPS